MLDKLIAKEQRKPKQLTIEEAIAAQTNTPNTAEATKIEPTQPQNSMINTLPFFVSIEPTFNRPQAFALGNHQLLLIAPDLTSFEEKLLQFLEGESGK